MVLENLLEETLLTSMVLSPNTGTIKKVKRIRIEEIFFIDIPFRELKVQERPQVCFRLLSSLASVIALLFT